MRSGSVMVAALGFEGDLLAAPQTRGSPIGFGGAVGRNDQRVNGLAHRLRCGVAEHALELAVHALRTEGGIEDNEGVGRTLEQLFEVLTAEVGISPVSSCGQPFSAEFFSASSAGHQEREDGWAAGLGIVGGINVGAAPRLSARRKPLARTSSPDCGARVTQSPISEASL